MRDWIVEDVSDEYDEDEQNQSEKMMWGDIQSLA